LKASQNNNTEIVKLLIDYANNNEINLKLNDKNKDGKSIAKYADENNNRDIIRLLSDYASENGIKLQMVEVDENEQPFLLVES